MDRLKEYIRNRAEVMQIVPTEIWCYPEDYSMVVAVLRASVKAESGGGDACLKPGEED